MKLEATAGATAGASVLQLILQTLPPLHEMRRDLLPQADSIMQASVATGQLQESVDQVQRRCSLRVSQSGLEQSALSELYAAML